MMHFNVSVDDIQEILLDLDEKITALTALFEEYRSYVNIEKDEKNQNILPFKVILQEKMLSLITYLKGRCAYLDKVFDLKVWKHPPHYFNFSNVDKLVKEAKKVKKEIERKIQLLDL